MPVLSAQMQKDMFSLQDEDVANPRRSFTQAVCRICQLGMVCRHADDMLPLLKIMSGLPDSTEDHAQKKIQVFDNAKQDPFRRCLCVESQTSNECFWQDLSSTSIARHLLGGSPSLGPFEPLGSGGN